MPITDADILRTILESVGSALSIEAAQSILRLRFSDRQIRRMHKLAEKNNEGTLTRAERAEMESYARVGNFLSLLQSAVRRST